MSDECVRVVVVECVQSMDTSPSPSASELIQFIGYLSATSCSARLFDDLQSSRDEEWLMIVNGAANQTRTAFSHRLHCNTLHIHCETNGKRVQRLKAHENNV